MFLRVVSLCTRNVKLIDPLFKAWERILVYLVEPGLTASLEANHDYCVCPLPCTEGSWPDWKARQLIGIPSIKLYFHCIY